VAVTVAAGLAVSAATASPKKHATTKSSHLLVGINDEAFSLYGDPTTAFATLKALNTQVIRVNLYWGGTKWAVAIRGASTVVPAASASASRIDDRLVRYATQNNIKVVFSILFTPGWANGGKARTSRPRTSRIWRISRIPLRSATAGSDSAGVAAGPIEPDHEAAAPKVNMWTAWNEPNNPIWLTPQYKRVGKTWRVESAFNYAKICNAVMAGVHSPFLDAPRRARLRRHRTEGNDAPGRVARRWIR
jgi:hypothetical protein